MIVWTERLSGLGLRKSRLGWFEPGSNSNEISGRIIFLQSQFHKQSIPPFITMYVGHSTRFGKMALAAAMAVARPNATTILTLSTRRTNPRFTFSIAASRSHSSSSSSFSGTLVLYSKPGCCLCDGLKEKLQAAFLLSGPDSLQDVQLQVRDITTNSDWENAYQYEIPVLAKVLSDGSEEILPRLSPRLGVELLQKKLAASLRQ